MQVISFDLPIGIAEAGPQILSLHPGDCILVQGMSGSGKTVLFQKMIALLESSYSDALELIAIYDSKGCEYRLTEKPLKRLVFCGEKSHDDFLKFLKGFSLNKKGKPAFVFIDEAYILSYYGEPRKIIEEFLRTNQHAVVVISAQAMATLLPFEDLADTFIQFHPQKTGDFCMEAQEATCVSMHVALP